MFVYYWLWAKEDLIFFCICLYLILLSFSHWQKNKCNKYKGRVAYLRKPPLQIWQTPFLNETLWKQQPQDYTNQQDIINPSLPCANPPYLENKLLCEKILATGFNSIVCLIAVQHPGRLVFFGSLLFLPPIHIEPTGTCCVFDPTLSLLHEFGSTKITPLPPNLPVDQKAGFEIVGPIYLMTRMIYYASISFTLLVRSQHWFTFSHLWEIWKGEVALLAQGTGVVPDGAKNLCRSFVNKPFWI